MGVRTIECSVQGTRRRYSIITQVVMDAEFQENDPERQQLLEELLLSAGVTSEEEAFNLLNNVAPPAPSKSIVPQPGFCIKTKNVSGEKIFINICYSEQIPEPNEVSDEKLIELLNAEEPGEYRIPMSIGEAHAEVDNSGHGCTAYDIVLNPQLLAKLHERQILMGFVLTVVIEGLENKYSISLSRDWRLLKNRKFLGSLPEQNVRTRSQPLIREMDETSPAKPLIAEIPSSEQQKSAVKAPEPAYTILQEPPTGHPEFLVAEIHLPNVKSAASLQLDIGEDRFLLETRANLYRLDIYLPYNLIEEESAAQFNAKSRILTLTMPVQPSS